MKIIFLGAGSAFTTDASNYNSNILLVDPINSRKLLIDCGSDARHSLRKQGYSHLDITDVYISHLHADHAGGLEWLALSRYFDATATQPNLYANEQIIKDVWRKTLSGGMETLSAKEVNLSTFFNVHAIPTGGAFVWNDIEFQVVQTVHVVAGHSLMPSHGLMFKVNNTRIFITTDTQFVLDHFQSYYRAADIIFHDCETSALPSGVHAHFNELVTLDDAIKSRMWLYHYNDDILPDAKVQGFLGFVQCGQTFNI